MDAVQDPRGVVLTNLEYREAGRTITGQFSYGPYAEIAATGIVRRERFAPGAFRESIAGDGDIHLLVGHNFNQPLASRLAGSFRLVDSPSGVDFVATLPPESKRPSWMHDTVLAIQSGLVRGVSPGFKATGEALERDPHYPAFQARVVQRANLFELSVLPRPAYTEGNILEVRLFGGVSPSQNTFWKDSILMDQAYLLNKLKVAAWDEDRAGLVDRMREAADYADDENMELRNVGRVAKGLMDLLEAGVTAKQVVDSTDKRADDMSPEEMEAMAWL